MKLKTFFQKFRHLFILGAVMLFVVASMAWVGYDTVRESVGLGHRQIVNDEYSVLTEAIDGTGVTQPITVKANTNFYGVNLNMHTYNRVVFGEIFVELQDTAGNVLAVAKDDMTNIKDNTFMRFTFGEQNFKNEETKDYILHIYTNPQTEEDKVAMWKSEATVDGYGTMTENGVEVQGTLALQYIVKYVTSAIWNYYFVLCGLILILVAGAYLLIFVKKVKVSTAFVFIAAVLGMVFSIFTPIRGGADEYTHIASSYYGANQVLIEGKSYDEGHLLMRRCDADDFLNTVNYNAFELHKLYEGLTEDVSGKTDIVYVRANVAEVFPPLYWAQTLGVIVARLLGVNYAMLIVFGRLANLMLYIVLVWLAIRKMPFFKTLMATIAVTPVPLQTAASFNYDTLVIGLCFLFIATVLDFAYNKEKVALKDIAVIVLLTAFIAPSKTVYVLIIGMLFIIPFEKFGSRKRFLASMAAVVFTACFMWLAYNQSFVNIVRDNISTYIPQLAVEKEEAEPWDPSQDIQLDQTEYNGVEIVVVEKEQQEDLDFIYGEQVYSDGILSNGDSSQYFTISYILSHIPQTVKLVINTVQENTVLYVRQIFGGILGEVIISPVKINWLYVMAVIAVVMATTVLPQGETLQYKGVKKWWCFAIALAIFMLVCAAGVMWTPTNYTTAFGIQGRYIIPVLPLIILLFTNENITFKKKIDGQLIYALCLTDALIILNGLTIMMANTTVKY